jgi:hypothetical protein
LAKLGILTEVFSAAKPSCPERMTKRRLRQVAKYVRRWLLKRKRTAKPARNGDGAR